MLYIIFPDHGCYIDCLSNQCRSLFVLGIFSPTSYYYYNKPDLQQKSVSTKTFETFENTITLLLFHYWYLNVVIEEKCGDSFVDWFKNQTGCQIDKETHFLFDPGNYSSLALFPPNCDYCKINLNFYNSIDIELDDLRYGSACSIHVV